ncbi:hypothetical protein B0H66DRAFT_336388 [Apodospora peruviana]|uniref:Uncharacterized protein n=1 Tax=Apodospora peruviana TaxID=516989 RepID=A0AAE0HYH9_9PEZI|nr:hypothetical protein B0H66DRAFT_336388 [Apodospora peruviana]
MYVQYYAVCTISAGGRRTALLILSLSVQSPHLVEAIGGGKSVPCLMAAAAQRGTRRLFRLVSLTRTPRSQIEASSLRILHVYTDSSSLHMLVVCGLPCNVPEEGQHRVREATNAYQSVGTAAWLHGSVARWDGYPSMGFLEDST